MAIARWLLLALAPTTAWAGGLTLDVGDLELGERVTFTVSGLAPGEEALLVRGAGIGGGPCLPALGGACLDVVSPAVVSPVVGGPDGTGALTITLPPSLPVGLSVAFQAVVADGPASRLSDPAAGETRLPVDDPRDPGDLEAPEVVYGVPNTDDDDEDGRVDIVMGGDLVDVTPFTVTPDPAGAERSVARHRLSLSGEADVVVRLDDAVVLNRLMGLETHDLAWSPDVLELSVEFGNYNVTVELIVDELDAEGRLLDQRVVRLTSAPLILNHHLQPAETVFGVRTRGGFFIGDNVEFITPMADALGDMFWSVEGSTVGNDVWIQDEVEFATSRADGQHVDIVVDSIRDRGLDVWPENAFFGPDWAVHTFGSGWANTYDSFGNLEVTPPITVGDVTYPFGRIYYGLGARSGPVDGLTDYLASQQVQAPFELDTSWLCVGHVDEFMSFVPDASAPKGFRLIYTDTQAAWDIIDAMDPATVLPRYRDHHLGSVYAFQTDAELRSYNDDIQAMYLDPIEAQLRDELGLTDDDIVYIPGLFEGACGRTAAALIPGMANLVVANPEGGDSKLLMADPFFRTDGADRSADPFVAALEDLVPAEHGIVWVDDWDDYHLLLGEVHCGTNVIRTSTTDWWTDADALDLLED